MVATSKHLLQVAKTPRQRTSTETLSLKVRSLLVSPWKCYLKTTSKRCSRCQTWSTRSPSSNASPSRFKTTQCLPARAWNSSSSLSDLRWNSTPRLRLAVRRTTRLRTLTILTRTPRSGGQPQEAPFMSAATAGSMAWKMKDVSSHRPGQFIKMICAAMRTNPSGFRFTINLIGVLYRK